jgi:aspartate/methionine/tyrosine aminotransferase
MKEVKIGSRMPDRAKIKPFKLERYFAAYEFKASHLLSPSDCESWSVTELVRMAAPATLDLWRELRLGYTETAGHPLLRAEVAGLYETIAPDGVMIAAPEEAIFIAMQTLLAPGDHVIVVAPAYQSLYEVARQIGCRVTRWKLEPDHDGWRLDAGRLERLIEGDTRMLVINFPHNPTGHTLSRPELDSIVAVARRRGLYVFSDEMYRLLEYDSDARLPAVCDRYEKGISLAGLSKAFGLPGLRIGWLATQERALLGRWLAFKDYTTICASAPSEILAIIALQNREAILQRNREIVGSNLAITESFFSEHESRFAWLAPRAGPVAFPRWLGDEPVERFCREALDGAGVMIVPGRVFETPGGYFRIGLGRKSYAAALGRLAEHLRGRRL